MNIATRKPLQTIRSQWTIGTQEVIPGLPPALMAERNTSDGRLRVFAANEPGIGWHLSISHTGHNGKILRYPSWDEIADARDHFLPNDLDFAMHLPPAIEYVAVHDTCFHLHQHPAKLDQAIIDHAIKMRDAYKAGGHILADEWDVIRSQFFKALEVAGK